MYVASQLLVCIRCGAKQAYGVDANRDEEIDAQYHAVPHNVVEQLHMYESVIIVFRRPMWFFSFFSSETRPMCGNEQVGSRRKSTG